MKDLKLDCYQGTRLLDHHYLWEMFEYRNGELFWKERSIRHFQYFHTWKNWNARYANTQAGTRANYSQRRKHRRITIDGSSYYLSRIIWLYHNAEMPDYCWHRDGDRQNCALENLEALSTKEHLKRVAHLSRYHALERNVREKLTVSGFTAQ